MKGIHVKVTFLLPLFKLVQYLIVVTEKYSLSNIYLRYSPLFYLIIIPVFMTEICTFFREKNVVLDVCYERNSSAVFG